MSKPSIIIKNNKRGIGIDVGWRITCTDGFHDSMWGNTKNEQSLRLLLDDIRREYGERQIIDERTPEEAGMEIRNV